MLDVWQGSESASVQVFSFELLLMYFLKNFPQILSCDVLEFWEHLPLEYLSLVTSEWSP